MADFTSIVRLGHSGPDRGWVLVPLINEVIESQPAWSRLKVVRVTAQTAEDITASPIGKVGGQWLTVNVTHPAYSLQHGARVGGRFTSGGGGR